jgi:hypothetical protein
METVLSLLFAVSPEAVEFCSGYRTLAFTMSSVSRCQPTVLSVSKCRSSLLCGNSTWLTVCRVSRCQPTVSSVSRCCRTSLLCGVPSLPFAVSPEAVELCTGHQPQPAGSLQARHRLICRQASRLHHHLKSSGNTLEEVRYFLL